MRWAWLVTRHWRRDSSGKGTSPSTAALSLLLCPADPLLQSFGRQNFANQANPQERFAPSGGRLCHAEIQLPKERAITKRSKLPVNTPELPTPAQQRKANEDGGRVQGGGVQGGGTAELVKKDWPKAGAAYADGIKLIKAAEVVKTAKPAPFEVAPAAGCKELDEPRNASDWKGMAEDARIQPADPASTLSTNNPPAEAVGRMSWACTGFSINGKGQLRIQSATAARRPRRTALVVSSVSQHLVEADFTRLLAHTPDQQGGQGGFMRAIPGRDANFNRLSHWILLFDSPYNAASFQHRLRWYHANAILNLPVDPHTAATTKNRELAPPEGYIDPLSGEDMWKRLHEFSLLLPTQSFTVTALLEPFPETVRTDLRSYELWRFPTSTSKSWPVRIWIDDYYLDARLAERFLGASSMEREHRWKLVEGAKSIEPMFYTPFNSNGDRIDHEGNQLSKQDIASLHASPQKNWLVRFRTQGNAQIFWRTWHRRPFPTSISPLPEERLLHVDPLW